METTSETLATAAYNRLRAEIISGAIDPGRRLRIQPLCERLGIGLSPLREGLNRLATEGLVVQSDRRGFTTAPLDLADLADLTMARTALNAVALRDAMAHGDAAWEEAILLAHHRLARAPGPTPDAGPGPTDATSLAWEACHRTFHATLLAACRSRRIVLYCDQLFDAAERYRLASRTGAPGQRDVAGEHAAIMRAVVDRKADQAVALLHEHVERTAALVRDALGGGRAGSL